MKISEISIGNWVMHPDGHPIQVNRIHFSEVQGILIYTDRSYNNYTADIDFLRPIPITEEFLKKNDFEHEYDELCEFNYYIREIDDYYVDIQLECANMGDEYVTCHIDNCDRSTVASADIRYVHQLQNLLNLFEIEWDVKI